MGSDSLFSFINAIHIEQGIQPCELQEDVGTALVAVRNMLGQGQALSLRTKKTEGVHQLADANSRVLKTAKASFRTPKNLFLHSPSENVNEKTDHKSTQKKFETSD
jgi:hypothetical protein